MSAVGHRGVGTLGRDYSHHTIEGNQLRLLGHALLPAAFCLAR
jgi:hypothetical protein